MSLISKVTSDMAHLVVYSVHVWLYGASIAQTLFRPSGLWDKFNLDCISKKTDQQFELTFKIKYLGMEVCKVIPLLKVNLEHFTLAKIIAYVVDITVVKFY